MRKKDEENKGEKIKRALHEGLVSVELLPLQLRERSEISVQLGDTKNIGGHPLYIYLNFRTKKYINFSLQNI